LRANEAPLACQSNIIWIKGREVKNARVCTVALLAIATSALVHAQDIARPHLLLKERVAGMPTGNTQELSVLTATLKPGDRTVLHTHRFPVVVYVTAGAFTLELEGRAPITVKAGAALVEPANVKMTGYNRSATEPAKVVIVYASDPDMPFLDPVPQ
jgi:quercetin dioxygenase-like cupin family protein